MLAWKRNVGAAEAGVAQGLRRGTGARGAALGERPELPYKSPVN